MANVTGSICFVCLQLAIRDVPLKQLELGSWQGGCPMQTTVCGLGETLSPAREITPVPSVTECAQTL